MSRREFGREACNRSLQIRQQLSTVFQTVAQQSEEMWRVCILPALQRLLHVVEPSPDGFEIFCCEESGFFQMIEETL